MSSDAKWKDLVADKQRRQQESIPAAWRIDAPGPEVLNVMDVPRSCGLLSALELEITEITDVDVLLERLATGTWSSVEVTTAFYKRAIVAQQIVSSLRCCFALKY
jgi:amidase